MARIVFFNAEGRVTGVGSGSTPEFYDKNVAINPPSFNGLIAIGLLRKYWKKVVIARKKNAQNNWTMNDVEEMTQAEKDTVDAEETADQEAQEQARRDLNNQEKMLIAIVKAIVQEFNRNRDWHSQPNITYDQIRQAIRDNWPT